MSDQPPYIRPDRVQVNIWLSPEEVNALQSIGARLNVQPRLDGKRPVASVVRALARFALTRMAEDDARAKKSKRRTVSRKQGGRK